MTERKALVIIDGVTQELPSGDSLEGGGGSVSYPDFTNNAGKVLAVNETEDDVEWVVKSGGASGSEEPLPFARTTPVSNASLWSVTSTNTPGMGATDNVTMNADDEKGIFKVSSVGSGSVTRYAPPTTPISGTDFDYVFRVELYVPSDTYAAAGVYVENTATEEIYSTVRFHSGNWYGQKWDGDTFTEEDNKLSQANGGGFNGYMRVQRVGTDVTFYFSESGLEWTTIYVLDLTTYVTDVTRVGIIHNSTSITSGIPCSITVIGADYDGPQDRAAAAVGGTGSSTMNQPAPEGVSYTVSNADLAGNMVRRFSFSSAGTVTVPAGLTGTEPMTVIGTGSGAVSIVADTGVTINSADDLLSLRTQYSSATLIPDADTADTYYLIGDLS